MKSNKIMTRRVLLPGEILCQFNWTTYNGLYAAVVLCLKECCAKFNADKYITEWDG